MVQSFSRIVDAPANSSVGRPEKAHIQCASEYQAEHLEAKTILLGASIISGLTRYSAVWEDILNESISINFGIGGDKIQHVIHRCIYGIYPKSVKNVFIQAGSNNVNNLVWPATDIADAIITAGTEIQRRLPQANVCIIGILPRQCDKDKWFVPKKVSEINDNVKRLSINVGLNFIDPHSSFTGSDGELKRSLYFEDFLHLSERGNHTLASIIIGHIRRTNSEDDVIGF